MQYWWVSFSVTEVQATFTLVCSSLLSHLEQFQPLDRDKRDKAVVVSGGCVWGEEDGGKARFYTWTPQ